MTTPLDPASAPPADDARAMVRRYGARQAARRSAVPLAILGLAGMAGLAALVLRRSDAAPPDALRRPLSRVGETISQVSGGAQSLARDAQARLGTARRRTLGTAHEEPLVIAALGAAIGLAISAALPATAAERRWLGPNRRRWVEGARTAVEDLATSAVEALGGAAEAALAHVAPTDAATAQADSTGGLAPATAPRPRAPRPARKSATAATPGRDASSQP